MTSSIFRGFKELHNCLRRLFCWGKKSPSEEPLGYEAFVAGYWYEPEQHNLEFDRFLSRKGNVNITGNNTESVGICINGGGSKPLTLPPSGPVVRRVVYENGNVSTLDGPKTRIEFKKILETTSPKLFPMPNGMGIIADEFALIKNRDFNELATTLYQNQCKLTVVQLIYGPVAIVPQSDTFY